MEKKRIYFKSQDRLSDFIEQKEKAIKEKRQTVQWERHRNSDWRSRKSLLKQLRSSPESPNKPVKQEKKSDHEVLIIKENAELTEFTNGNELPENLKHNFYEIANLGDGISLKNIKKKEFLGCNHCSKENFAGGLLADDVGYTTQLLYFIEWHSQRTMVTNLT